MSEKISEDDEKKKQKKAKKEARSIERLKTAYKIIIALLIIAFVFWYSINIDKESKLTIYQKAGTNTSGVSVPMKDALIIREYAINQYKDLLVSNDYKAAYSMMSEEYQEYMPYEEYVKTLAGMDASTLDMQSIKQITNYAFEAKVRYKKDGEYVETIYLLYPNKYNEKKYTISPDKFLYSYKDRSFKTDGIELTMDECVVYVDYVTLKGRIKNVEWNDDIKINKLAVSYNSSLNK